jgi:hypothetical protein
MNIRSLYETLVVEGYKSNRHANIDIEVVRLEKNIKHIHNDYYLI